MIPEAGSIRRDLLKMTALILKSDNFIADGLRSQWITYRNALQDMDVTAENPIFPTMPDEPTFPLTAGQLTQRTRKDDAKTTAKNIPNWSTWSQVVFQTWCDDNLMTDAQINATSLSAELKTNLKANNAFTRNSGKLIIALRDEIWPDSPDL